MSHSIRVCACGVPSVFCAAVPAPAHNKQWSHCKTSHFEHEACTISLFMPYGRTEPQSSRYECIIVAKTANFNYQKVMRFWLRLIYGFSRRLCLFLHGFLSFHEKNVGFTRLLYLNYCLQKCSLRIEEQIQIYMRLKHIFICLLRQTEKRNIKKITLVLISSSITGHLVIYY